MKDLKSIGDSYITIMQKRRNKKHSPPMFTVAEWCILGWCMFTTLYVAIRAY